MGSRPKVGQSAIATERMPSVNTEGEEIKGRWPEVVGLTVEDAKNIIRKDKPRALFEVVPPNSCVSQDFRPQRVRLYVDHAGIIKRPPCIG
ncbi:subtilisin inhibitor CLSI-I [Cinnamomum micranthum f. kanehirae]|uniref:Subtilisin inhibitor CLSI-I n=1 Tax=Cinnamomum micranthum f. kanehirae TaxID=337451 RepID=A0A443NDR7_9MAGN|nr:subtilisin inhibitor CLSI-I [Cinnamomum micranthum f. kanehirae]